MAICRPDEMIALCRPDEPSQITLRTTGVEARVAVHMIEMIEIREIWDGHAVGIEATFEHRDAVMSTTFDSDTIAQAYLGETQFDLIIVVLAGAYFAYRLTFPTE